MTKRQPDAATYAPTPARTIDSWIEGHALLSPGKPALVFHGEAISYAALHRRIVDTAAWLSNAGLVRGDRIAWYGRNSDAQIVLIFAAARLGLILVPLNWRLAPAELNYVLGDAGARYLFHDGHFEDRLEAVSAGLDLAVLSVDQLCEKVRSEPVETGQPTEALIGDPLLLVYTSGTTGRPKGAVLTQQAALWNAMSSQNAFRLTSRDRTFNLLPMFHVGGINIQTLPTFLCGGTVVLVTQFDPDSFFDIMQKGEITQVTVVPAILAALIADERWNDFNAETLTCMAIGSTDVPVPLIEAVHARGVPMVQVYGATETGPVTIYQPIDEAFDTVGSIGRCGLHSRVRLVGPDGKDVESGEAGEIWVKAPNCFSGYWHNEQVTSESIVDGWFRTGDVAMRDADGLYWFRDRVKNVIISGGENIYPAEVERVLRQVEGVAECCVVGRPDERWGQVPVAVLATAGETISTERLRAAMEGSLARFKQPKDFIQVVELPRNAMGKIVVDSVRDIALKAG